MSGPVDVLALIRLAASDYRAQGHAGAANEMLDAAAAVAELVDANKALLASEPAHATYRNAKEREAYKSIRAALARVGGDA